MQICRKDNSTDYSVQLAKWPHNRAAAFTITIDHTWGYMEPWEAWLRRVIADSALPIDVDFTPEYLYSPLQISCATDTLRPLGITFFGHGYLHVNTDAMSYDTALHNFRRCREEMLKYGFKPVVYAYPGGYGHNPSTRKACADAGFLCGRMFSPLESPYIAPDSATTPSDWFRLPTLAMFSRVWHTSDPLLPKDAPIVHSTAELAPFLDTAVQRKAWLILTYHAINRPNASTYEPREFLSDVAAIKARDAWLGSLHDMTLYLRERTASKLSVEAVRTTSGNVAELHIALDDALDDTFYNVPLTVLVRVPEAWRGKSYELLHNGRSVSMASAEPYQEHAGCVMLQLLPTSKPYTLRLR
jgi:hypothetical protein